MSALLEVQGLETAYGSSQVLFGIDLQVESGQVATLLGRNGMGKTTTVRSVLGLTRSKGGTVRFRGERIDQLGADKIARMGLADAWTACGDRASRRPLHAGHAGRDAGIHRSHAEAAGEHSAATGGPSAAS